MWIMYENNLFINSIEDSLFAKIKYVANKKAVLQIRNKVNKFLHPQ